MVVIFLIYKNNSNRTYTYYGVLFNPGDISFVPGYINNPMFEVQSQIRGTVQQSAPISAAETSNSDRLSESDIDALFNTDANERKVSTRKSKQRVKEGSDD